MLRTLSQVSRRDADSHTKRVPDLPIRTRVPVRACAKARELIPLHQIAHTRAAFLVSTDLQTYRDSLPSEGRRRALLCEATRRLLRATDVRCLSSPSRANPMMLVGAGVHIMTDSIAETHLSDSSHPPPQTAWQDCPRWTHSHQHHQADRWPQLPPARPLLPCRFRHLAASDQSLMLAARNPRKQERGR